MNEPKLAIKMFYWKKRILPRLPLAVAQKFSKRAWNYFGVGNAGDLVNETIAEKYYSGTEVVIKDFGPRLLCVGSVAQYIESGDLVCGIGCRDDTIKKRPNVEVVGLRGPISYDIFKRAGYDLSNVKFLADPGLLAGSLYPQTSAIPNRTIFVPHYRERLAARKIMPKGIKFVDIDCSPEHLAKEIMEAEFVYTSSLHGMVFAHALGRPCLLTKPMTNEPMLKYDDYFLSINSNLPEQLFFIDEVANIRKQDSPKSVSGPTSEIQMPNLETLIKRNVIVNAQ